MNAGTKLAPGIALLFAFLGCAGSVRIQSQRRPEFDKKLSRVLVVLTPGRLSDDLVSEVQAQLASELKARDVEVGCALLQGELALDDGPSLEKQVKDFNASSVFFLNPAGGLVSSAGGLVTAIFDGKILDLALRKIIWRARISYSPGGTAISVERRAKVLVREIVTALVADELVRAVPADAPNQPSAPDSPDADGTP